MELKLDAAKWRKTRGMTRLLDALGADEGLTRYVGGAVRDDLLGLPVNDVDLATRLAPDEVIRRLEKAKIKAVPTGIDHGTITAVSDGHPFEITTLRRDVSTDGRRATVAFTDDWKEDAARRDFTINALVRRSARPARSSTISAASTISSTGTSASSAIRCSASPRTICGSCASSASMRASARASPTRRRSTPAPRAPTT